MGLGAPTLLEQINVSRIVTDEEIRQLFPQTSTGLFRWAGDVFEVALGRELVPFLFDGLRYILILGSPMYEAGNQDVLGDLTSAWADGFQPEANSRIIKFVRSEADEFHFDPAKWKLHHAGQIFGFSDVLLAAMETYIAAKPEIEQFFFWPTTPQLETLYKRVFRNLERGCHGGRFKPILQPLGVFNGYQRSQAT